MVENYEGKKWTFGELKEEFARLGLGLIVPKNAADDEEVYSIQDQILSPILKRVFTPWTYIRFLRNLEQREKQSKGKGGKH